MTWWDNFASFTTDQMMPFLNEFSDVLGAWMLVLFVLFLVLGVVALIIGFFATKIYYMVLERKERHTYIYAVIDEYYRLCEYRKGGPCDAETVKEFLSAE